MGNITKNKTSKATMKKKTKTLALKIPTGIKDLVFIIWSALEIDSK